MNFIFKSFIHLIVIFLFLFSFFNISSAFANSNSQLPGDDSLFNLAIRKHEFSYYDEPSVSPDGQWIAYTVKERVDTPTEFQCFLPDGTPTCMAGSCIYLSNLEGDQTHAIAPTNGNSWRPVWSPNGKQLAFYSNASGKCNLWIYDQSSGLLKQLSELPINTCHYAAIDKPIWNPEGTEIYVPLALSNQLESKISFFKIKSELPSPNQNGAIVKTFSTHQEPSTDKLEIQQVDFSWWISSLAAIDVKTGSARIVIPNRTDPAPCHMKLSSTGKWLSYKTVPKLMDHPGKANFDLVVSCTKDNSKVITVVKDLIDQGDKDYIWHPIKDILAYEKDKKIHLVELDDRGIKQNTVFFKDSPIEFVNNPLLFTQDGNFLIVGGKPYYESYRDKPASLFIISLTESTAPIEIQFKSPWKYVSVINASESQAWQEKEDEIAVILERADTGERAIAKLSIKHSASTDQGHFVWQGTAKLKPYPAKKNPDVNYCLYEDLTTPSNIYRTGIDFSINHRITDIEPELNQMTPTLSRVFETYIPSYDGQLKKVKTTVLLPENYNAENPPPGIVLFYPGVNMSDCANAFAGGDPVTISNFLFLNQGYALVLVDIPLRPDGEASHRIQEITNALLPQVYHAIDLAYVDPERIGIMGHSYGGYSTAAMITQTNLFRAAVASAGCYDLAGAYGYFDDNLFFFSMQWSEHGQGGMGMPPWDNLQHYFENSPYYLADKIHTPLLLIHGEDDQTCPVIEARKMFTALKRLNREAELAIYPGQDHAMLEWTQASALDGAKRVISFFNSHLLTPDVDKRDMKTTSK